tara:strand:+ start:282 stop:671 length:390 start_codon:yes stop_codon:yes gene_type:complete
MASELRVNTLKDASGNNSVATSVVASGSAKAWVNFNGTGTVAIRDTENVSSILDEGTGDYTINFTNSMSDANYNHVAGGQQVLSAANREIKIPGDTTPTSSALQLWTSTHTSGNMDFAFISVSNHGDLA